MGFNLAFKELDCFKFVISVLLINVLVYGGGTVVKVPCYKSEGRWFDPRCFHWNFSLT